MKNRIQDQLIQPDVIIGATAEGTKAMVKDEMSQVGEDRDLGIL